MIGMEPWRERGTTSRARGVTGEATRRVADGRSSSSRARARGEAGTWRTLGPSRERRSATVSVSGVGTAACRNPPSRIKNSGCPAGHRSRVLEVGTEAPDSVPLQRPRKSRGAGGVLGRRRPSGARNGRRLRALSHLKWIILFNGVGWSEFYVNMDRSGLG